MTAKRIIPCLDVDRGLVVKGVNFMGLREVGDPLRMAMEYRDQGADELVFLDITATVENRRAMVELVRAIARELDIPFTVGGGIRGLEEAREMLWNGADKVSINTAAIRNPGIITALADVYGSQSVVVAIDAKLDPATGKYVAYVEGGRRSAGIDAVEWARRAEGLGAGELLVTSIDRDGTGLGYDTELLRRMREAVSVPIIASGGAGSPEHFYEVLAGDLADAALAASLFHFKRLSIMELKGYLKERGVEVRL